MNIVFENRAFQKEIYREAAKVAKERREIKGTLFKFEVNPYPSP
jgi:hypothetical protein